MKWFNRAATADAQLRLLLRMFADQGSAMFVKGASDSKEKSKEADPARINGRLFSQFVLAVGLRAYNFPITLEEEANAHTEGFGDRGLDGVAVAIGRELLAPEDDLAAILRANPGQNPRILFVQSKLIDGKKDDRIDANDVALFGPSVRDFLASKPKDYLRVKTNEEIEAQHAIYHGLKDAFEKSKRPWAPSIYLVFGASKSYEHYAGPANANKSNIEITTSAAPAARVSSVIWGSENLVKNAELGGVQHKRQISGVKLLEIPHGPASKAYQGFAPAKSVVQALTVKVDGEDQLLEQFFADNPRSRLEFEENENPGALGIARALNENRGNRIVLGHNGIVFTALGATLKGSSLELTAAQVVNGCQSCHAFFENRSKLDNVFVPIRIIVTSDEGVRDDVIIASNSQALIDDYDILACRPEVRALQLNFEEMSWHAPDRLWLQRRRNEALECPKGWHIRDRTIRPRELVDTFAAALLGSPHTVHSQRMWSLNKAKAGEIFAPGHEPTLYRALGWLMTTGRRWGTRNKDRGTW
jgi:AIPR protein